MADKIVVQTLVSRTTATCICQNCGREYQEEIYLTCSEFVPLCGCHSPAPLVQFKSLTDSERSRDGNNNPTEND